MIGRIIFGQLLLQKQSKREIKMIRLMGLIDLGKNFKKVNEYVEEENQPGQEFDDHEGSMAKSDLLAIHKQAGELYNMMGENDQLEGWVQAKITKAADYINAVYNNMQYEKTKPTSVGDGMGSPADATMTEI
jgi:hypothetical protein